MTQTHAAPRTSKQCMELFFYTWMALYLLGIVAGLLAGRAALLANESALSSFCANFVAVTSRSALVQAGASAGFLLLSLLVSQLPGGRSLLWLLVPAKAFSTAFVFSVFFMLRQQGTISAVGASVALHTALFLPAFYLLCLHCRRGSLAGRGPYWFRHRILPILLLFFYLLPAALLEHHLLTRFF